MSLITPQWRIEDADQNQVLFLASAQEMPIMLIEHIDISRSDREYVALHVFDFTFSSNAITRLQVVSVVQE